MSVTSIESVVEQAALVWLEAADWRIAHCSDIEPVTPSAERRNNGDVLLSQCLSRALDAASR
jgi:type I restriction enzyme R subunit